MTPRKMALAVFIVFGLSQHAKSDFQHELEGGFAKASLESEQSYKDQDADYYSGRYTYFLDSVKPFSELLAESAFFSRSTFLSFETTRAVQVPKDDFLRARVTFDWGREDLNHRLRAGFVYAEHKAERRNRHLNGGLLGVSVYLLDTAKADIDTTYISGDGLC